MSIGRDIITSIFIIVVGIFGMLAYREHSKDNSSLYEKVDAKITDVQSETIYDNNNVPSINLYAAYKYTVDKNDFTGRYLHGNYSVLFQQTGYNEILNGKRDIKVFYEKANPMNSALSFPKNNFILYAVITVVAVVVAIVSAFVTFGTPKYISPVQNFQQSRFY